MIIDYNNYDTMTDNPMVDNNFDFRDSKDWYLSMPFFTKHLSSGVLEQYPENPESVRVANSWEMKQDRSSSIQHSDSHVISLMDAMTTENIIHAITRYFDITVRTNKQTTTLTNNGKNVREKKTRNDVDGDEYDVLVSDVMEPQDERAFMLKCAPSETVDVRAYMDRIRRYTHASHASYYHMMVYLQRFVESTQVVLTERNAHKILLACMIVAIKFCEDRVQLNEYYARVGGLSTRDVNHLEVLLLKYLDWNLTVSEEELVSVVHQLDNYSALHHFEQECQGEYGMRVDEYIREMREIHMPIEPSVDEDEELETEKKSEGSEESEDDGMDIEEVRMEMMDNDDEDDEDLDLDDDDDEEEEDYVLVSPPAHHNHGSMSKQTSVQNQRIGEMMEKTFANVRRGARDSLNVFLSTVGATMIGDDDQRESNQRNRW